MKHKDLCKEDAVGSKVKGDSQVRRKKQEEDWCEEAKLRMSKLGISGPVKAEWLDVTESCQQLGSNGTAERSDRKAKEKGGKLAEGEEKVQGGEGEGISSLPEVD